MCLSTYVCVCLKIINVSSLDKHYLLLGKHLENIFKLKNNFDSVKQRLSVKGKCLTRNCFICLQVWDTQSTYNCVKTMDGHAGIVLTLCSDG